MYRQTLILLKQITTKDRGNEQFEGGTNCILSKWLALCKKPARRRPFQDDFRAARQGLCDAPPPRVTLSWPATCWILLLRYESPSFKRPSCYKLYVVYTGALFIARNIKMSLMSFQYKMQQPHYMTQNPCTVCVIWYVHTQINIIW